MAEKYVKLNDIIDTLEHEWGYEGMREDLEKLPTADVVEVGTCEGCKNIAFREPYASMYPCVSCIRAIRLDYYEKGEIHNG